ncbi:MAG: PnuC protein [Pseudomonadota bacterium]
MEDLLLNYFAIDWLAMMLTFFAIYLLGNKSRHGFVLMMTGNGCWIVIGLLSSSLAMVVANTVFLVMNARAWLKWAADS